jgi:hypothetical protein
MTFLICVDRSIHTNPICGPCSTAGKTRNLALAANWKFSAHWVLAIAWFTGLVPRTNAKRTSELPPKNSTPRSRNTVHCRRRDGISEPITSHQNHKSWIFCNFQHSLSRNATISVDKTFGRLSQWDAPEPIASTSPAVGIDGAAPIRCTQIEAAMLAYPSAL